ncbi:ATP-NAD kinase family protein [Marinobacterium arenosum]|uniref:ATP-NAD kinase family protein n=1 Tax=Marinobacterium arenosum TaxID=2862496 RepID=UPI001C959761|nr:ATP-NAD kinase family protein [Marinobacterium arenosum]MBY4678107.1 ATP-NAD kinase family protein [Marinobacterium arenosum]
MFKLGLIVNPVAGLGGSVGLKGSDGVTEAALARGAVPRANERTGQALAVLAGLPVQLVTYPGEMGEDAARAAGFEPQVIGRIAAGATTPEDTERAARDMVEAGVDLLLFAGGDGTARNICNVLDERVPVLGIPAGVKIHSGVYAVTPKAAGEIVAMLVNGELVTLGDQEVRDIDEQAFREGKVRARYYGELRVPQEHRYLQSVKQGGRESEELVLDDIAAHVVEEMQPDVRYIMGSGSTVQAVMDELGLDNTLLGVDVVENGELIASDCTAAQLLELTDGHPARLVITLIGGQGHIIGRGNQQLSPELLRRLGKDNILLIATKTKLKELDGRPLIVDSGDQALNSEMSGVIPVITGYRDAVLYPVADL